MANKRRLAADNILSGHLTFIMLLQGTDDIVKLKVNERSEQDLLAEFPITGKASGWYFKIDEISNGCWRLTGSDKWGRKISIDGINPDDLLRKAEAEATVLNGESRAL